MSSGWITTSASLGGRVTTGVGLGITRGRSVIVRAFRILPGAQDKHAERSNRLVTGVSNGHCLPKAIVLPEKRTRTAALSEDLSTPVDMSAPAPDDPVIGVMFTLAVIALSVLTLGVGYLSLSSFLDSRQEEEDRKKSGFGPSSRASSDSGFNTSAFTESSSEKRTKKKKTPKKKSDKGFGV